MSMIPLRRSAVAVGLFAAVSLIAASFSPISRGNAQDAGFSGDQKKAIEKIVKDYLVANPEVLQEAMSVYEAKMEKAQAEKAKVALSENAKEIYRRVNAPVAGNVNGDITVTEFFDYNCGYCKKSLSDITKLIGEDKKVRVVFKEFPILSKGSEEAAKVALAARIQGKYWEVHTALLEAKGQANEASAMKIAEKLGLDLVKLKADIEGAEVKAELASVKELATKMGINGTPHFLVGDKSIAGAPQDLLPQLTSHIGDLRKTGCSFC
jgi:protein-disulfide isomerase